MNDDVVSADGGALVRRSVVVPFRESNHRLPEQGRIRFGIKKLTKAGKEYPSKIDTMRFTTHDQAALEQLATVVGGKVVAWTKGPRAGEYELISKTTSLRIALPTNVECLSQWYEKWTAGGCERRCDGVRFETSRPTPDGAEVTEVPCVCAANNVLECEATTRMTVLIRDAPFGGGWRFDTKSKIAREQLPEMVGLIKAMQAGGGVVPALLILKEFSDKKEIVCPKCRGRKCGECKGTGTVLLSRKWKVPTIALDGITIDDLIAGRGSLGALASGAQVRQHAIAAAAPVAQQAIEADASEVLDGELVTEDEAARYYGETGILDETDSGGGALGGDEPGPGTDHVPHDEGAAGPGKSSIERQRSMLHALVNQCCERGCAPGVDKDRFRHALIRTATGADQSSTSLLPDEMSKVLDLLTALAEGHVEFKGINEGFIRYVVREEKF